MANRILRIGYALGSRPCNFITFQRENTSEEFLDDIKVEYKKTTDSTYLDLTTELGGYSAALYYGYYAYQIRLSKTGMTGSELSEYIKIGTSTNSTGSTASSPSKLVDGDYIYLVYNSPSSAGFPSNSWYCGISGTTITYNYIISTTTQTSAKEPSIASVNYKYSNCTLKTDVTEVQDSKAYTITFEANEYYYFNNAGTLEYYNENNELETITGTISADKKTLTFDFEIASLLNESEIYISVNAIENTDYECSVEYDLTNVSISPKPTVIANGSSYIFTITPSKYYACDELPFLEYTHPSGLVKQVKGVYDVVHDIYTITTGNISLERNSTVYIYASASPIKAKIYNNLNNCTITPLKETYNKAEWNETEFIITVETGFIFNADVTATYTDVEGNDRKITGTINDDNTKATLTIGIIPIENGSVLMINGNAIEEANKNAITNIFILSNEHLQELKKKRYYTLTSIGTTSFSAQQIDLGNYILSLRKHYIPLPSGNNQSLILGYFNTNITCEQLIVKDYTVTVEIPPKLIKGIYNNSNDYNYGSIEIVLPFVGKQSLDVGKVLNHNIGVDYHFNLANGECICELYDYDDEIVIYYFNGKSGIDIPFTLEHNSNGVYLEVKNNLNQNNLCTLVNDFYISIRENDILPNQFNDETIIYINANECNGLTKVDDIVIDFEISAKDENDLRTILRNGVIF